MSKYSEMLQWDLEANVLQAMDPELTENEVEDKIWWWSLPRYLRVVPDGERCGGE